MLLIQPRHDALWQPRVAAGSGPSGDSRCDRRAAIIGRPTEGGITTIELPEKLTRPPQQFPESCRRRAVSLFDIGFATRVESPLSCSDDAYPDAPGHVSPDDEQAELDRCQLNRPRAFSKTEMWAHLALGLAVALVSAIDLLKREYPPNLDG